MCRQHAKTRFDVPNFINRPTCFAPYGASLCNWISPFAQAFYMIFQGEVYVIVTGTRLAILGQGESFGELGLDNKTVRTATVKVTDPIN